MKQNYEEAHVSTRQTQSNQVWDGIPVKRWSEYNLKKRKQHEQKGIASINKNVKQSKRIKVLTTQRYTRSVKILIEIVFLI